MESMVSASFWKDKNIFVTGHTGFKGTWLSHVLLTMGANIFGYSLPPKDTPSLYVLTNLQNRLHSTFGDIRDYNNLKKAFDEANPKIVIHLAAQPLVRDGYENPRYTYETNLMGTVNILECVRLSSNVKSFLNITTDKVYKNNEWNWGYREIDQIGGQDPYSNSKGCSELATNSYRESFFVNSKISISTARAGNVIGGGDFAKHRIIPDCVRAVQKKAPIMIRSPKSIRPYQHVLEPIFAYLMILEKQYVNNELQGNYNIGPNDCDCISTEQLTSIFCETWGDGAVWKCEENKGPHESNILKLDCSKIRNVFGWLPKWDIDEAINKTCEWTRDWLNNKNIVCTIENQIKEYMENQER